MAIDHLLMCSIDKFFENHERFMIMYNILNHKDDVSLRLLEFMFTKYSKRNQTLLILNGNPITVADVYTQGLSVHGKAKYDCFKRHNRVIFSKHGYSIETTVGQLHFFKHVIPTGVLEFARSHAQEIRVEMAQHLRRSRHPEEGRPKQPKRPRTQSIVGSLLLCPGKRMTIAI